VRSGFVSFKIVGCFFRRSGLWGKVQEVDGKPEIVKSVGLTLPSLCFPLPNLFWFFLVRRKAPFVLLQKNTQGKVKIK
jgi:hypothetical protein